MSDDKSITSKSLDVIFYIKFVCYSSNFINSKENKSMLMLFIFTAAPYYGYTA